MATDPIDSDVLRRPPRRQNAQLIDRAFLRRIIGTGVLTAGVAMLAFACDFYVGNGLAQARNAAFSTLVFAELLRSFGARSGERTVLQIGLFSNMRLFVVVAASFTLQLVIYRLPFLEGLFGVEPTSYLQYVLWISLGATPLVILEAAKMIRQSQPTHPRTDKDRRL